MRLGFAVKVLGGGGLPSHDTRRWRSRPHLSVSLDRLDAVLGYLERESIAMYRMSSALAPYATHPDLTGFDRQLDDCAERLAAVGARARALDVRLSTHPGQYVVLSSERADVRAAAARDLELQAALLDAMGLGPEAVVVLHVGSKAGGAAAGRDRFVRAFEALGERARARLAVENDDRSFSLADALDVSRRTGAPVVWDLLHHHCHDPERVPDAEALRLALATWPAGVVPKIHFSSPRTAVDERAGRLVLPPLRAHADMVDPIAFEYLLALAGGAPRFDVMLEAKAKDLALLRLREQLAARGWRIERGRVIR